MKMKNKEMTNEEKVLKTLKDFGRLPTSRIGAIIGINFESTEKLLESLQEDKKVIKYPETIATYWEVK